jgi:hypothetical protein
MGPARGIEPAGGKALLAFLDRHGALVLGIELALLAVATVGAISTDRYWSRAS